MPETSDKKELKFNADTIMYMLYLMYTANLLTRLHLKHMMKIIKDTPPTDIARYLVEEAAKSY